MAGCLWSVAGCGQEKNEVFDGAFFCFLLFSVFFVDFSISDLDFLFRAKTLVSWPTEFPENNLRTCDGQATLKRLQ